MLSAWLRMKYPQWFQGALAASAPILFFDGYVDPYAYDDIATGVYAKADEQCPISIKNGWSALNDLDPSYYPQLAEIFNLCEVPKSSAELRILSSILNSAFGTMVMVDYPYATDFVAPLPAWPINYACDQAAAAREAHADDPLADLWATSAAAMVYLNFNNQLECIDVSPKPEPNEGLDDNGWSVQYCNEMAMPFASRESTSMFPPSEWNERQNSLFCKAAYGESPQYSWALDYFGGVNPEKDFMKASNIIFSNGELDPWHAGGVLTNVSD